MLLEATDKPIRYRLKTGEEVTLRPGAPIELPDRAATQLLKRAPDMVRRVDGVPAIRPGVTIAWHGADGTPRGPATVDFVHTDSDGTSWAFYSLSDGGWGVVNTKYLTRMDRG